MEIISRIDALALGRTGYFTGKPCSKGHVSERLVHNSTCRACGVEATRRWISKNSERFKEKAKLWVQKNQHKINANQQRRRARKLRATPSWLTVSDCRKIEATYLYSKVRTNITGVPHHVDHIVPLRGESVCGLHVPWNLQVIPASENLQKSNKLFS
jgi:hypothetical protein